MTEYIDKDKLLDELRESAENSREQQRRTVNATRQKHCSRTICGRCSTRDSWKLDRFK